MSLTRNGRRTTSPFSASNASNKVRPGLSRSGRSRDGAANVASRQICECLPPFRPGAGRRRRHSRYCRGRILRHGGLKASGYGKDLSMYALEDYTVARHVMVKL